MPDRVWFATAQTTQGGSGFNGFPFFIPELAEDGLPFEIWDGTTMFGSLPSKSNTELISVITPNMVGMPREDLMKLFWVVRELEINFPVAVSASADGGYGTGILNLSVTRDGSPMIINRGGFTTGFPSELVFIERERDLILGGRWYLPTEEALEISRPEESETISPEEQFDGYRHIYYNDAAVTCGASGSLNIGGVLKKNELYYVGLGFNFSIGAGAEMLVQLIEAPDDPPYPGFLIGLATADLGVGAGYYSGTAAVEYYDEEGVLNVTLIGINGHTYTFPVVYYKSVTGWNIYEFSAGEAQASVTVNGATFTTSPETIWSFEGSEDPPTYTGADLPDLSDITITVNDHFPYAARNGTPIYDSSGNELQSPTA